MDRLNVFNPFKDKGDAHEDVLTRNFLILLKNIQSVQFVFMELIREKMKTVQIGSIALGEIRVSEVRTQVHSGTYLTNLQDYRVVSVVISDDKFTGDHTVRESERNAVYDGIVICDPSWLFIIENKPYVGNIWENQLDPNRDDVNNNELINEPCCLSWRDVISALNQIVQYDMVNKLEQTLIDDFMMYVKEKYAWLNPYSKFGLCNENKWLLNSRCNEVLKECFKGKELNYHNGWKYYIDTSDEDEVVTQTALDYDGSNIKLWMYAGEKKSSSIYFYRNFNEKKAKELYKTPGYIILPNYHLAYQGTVLLFLSTTQIDVFEYIDYWRNNDLKQVKREEFEDYYAKLVSQKIVDSNDDEVDKKIRSKDYPNFNVRPGILLAYEWPLDEAIRLDKDGRFVSDCLEKIKNLRAVYNKQQY